MREFEAFVQTASCARSAGLRVRRPLVACMWAAVIFAGCGPDYPTCDNDDDCKEHGEFCVNKQCQQCRSSKDCAAGNQCKAGRCSPIPGYCRSKRDCPGGAECRNHQCVAESTNDLNAPADSQSSTDTSGCSLSTIYFDFDSEDLQTSERNKLESNAKCIREKNFKAVQVTGFTDPRGTEEYNLALGDRRSRSVAQYMRSLGLDAAKLRTSSMGEEMASGNDEAGWARDRKVEFRSQ